MITGDVVASNVAMVDLVIGETVTDNVVVAW